MGELFYKRCSFFYERLIKSKKLIKDCNRREFILNIVLLLVIFLSVFIMIIAFVDILLTENSSFLHKELLGEVMLGMITFFWALCFIKKEIFQHCHYWDFNAFVFFG